MRRVFPPVSPVVLLEGHAFLVHRPLQLPLAGEDALVLHNHVVDQGVDQRLQGDGVVVVPTPHQTGTEADSQVVRLHHVLVAVLSHTERRQTHNGGTKGKCFWWSREWVEKY